MADSKEVKKDAEDQKKAEDTHDAESGEKSEESLGELSEEELLKAVEEAGLSKSLEKYVQSLTDRRVTDAIKTHEKKLKDKQRKEKEDKEKAETDKTMGETDQKVSRLEENLTQLTSMMTEFIGKAKTEKLALLKDVAIKDAGLPDEWKQLLDVDSEEKIPERVKLIKEGFAKLKDREIEAWASGQKQPFRSAGGSASDKIARVRQYIKDKAAVESKGAAAEQLGLTKK